MFYARASGRIEGKPLSRLTIAPDFLERPASSPSRARLNPKPNIFGMITDECDHWISGSSIGELIRSVDPYQPRSSLLCR